MTETLDYTRWQQPSSSPYEMLEANEEKRQMSYITDVERIAFGRGYAIGYERVIKEEARRSQERMGSLIFDS